MHGSDTMRAAIALAGNGHPVFPLRPTGKTPLTEHGFKDASTDPAVIEAWWDQWPNANLGMATGHTLDVLDVDVKPRKDGSLTPGMYTLRRLLEAWPWMREKRGDVVRTASGGLHLYFLPNPDTSRNSASAKLGIDYRGLGGYVVAPPSHVVYPDLGTEGVFETIREQTATGTFDYKAAVALLDPKPLRIVAPKESRVGLTRENTGRGSAAGLLRWLEDAPEGERNVRLNRCVYRLVNEGYWSQKTEAQVQAVALRIGLEHGETVQTIASAVAAAGVKS